MIRIVSTEKMREIEAAADAAGMTYDTMMQNAGRATAELAVKMISGLEDARVAVLIGPGNNGGDGLVAGRILAQEMNVQVRFYLLKRRDDEDANFKAVREAGLFVAFAEDDQQYRVLRNMAASSDLVIDALFGIGVKLPLKDEAAKVMRSVNQALHERRQARPERQTIDPTSPTSLDYFRTAPRVLAVDCPSGLNCDTGELDQNAIAADATITFIGAKPGLLTFPGAGAVGKLSVASIGITDNLAPLKAETLTLVDAQIAREMLPDRPANSHKGTYGSALIIAGSINYTGAPAMAALAAYRSGAGLVTIGAPQPVVAVVAAQSPEPTWLLLPHDMGVLSAKAAPMIREELGNYQSLLLGPGFGREDTTRDLLKDLFDKPVEVSARRSRRPIGFLSSKSDTQEAESVKNDFPPLVVDADGLNLLSEIDEWWTRLPANTIITPHPGEMARLAKTETTEVQNNRLALAASKAVEWNLIVVLKGAHTVVAAPDGQVAVLPFKTDALAKAGTGDVLAGIIAGLLAQGVAPYNAAVAGGYLHGLAGMLAAEMIGSGRSVIASDVIAALGDSFEMMHLA